MGRFLYICNWFPNYSDEPECTSGDMMIGSGVIKTIDIVSSAPKIKIPKALTVYQFKKRDERDYYIKLKYLGKYKVKFSNLAQWKNIGVSKFVNNIII